MMSDIPISSKGPTGGNALILQDEDRSAAYFGKFKPGFLMYVGPDSKLRNLKSTQATHKEIAMNWQNE